MTEAGRELLNVPGPHEGPTPAEAEAILEQMANAFAAAAPSPPGAAAKGHVGTRLRKAELRYRTLVEQLPAVTFMASLDEGLHELYVSPQIEGLLGFTQQEWLENPILWYTQLHPDDRERWQAEFARTCATGVDFCSEYRFLARDGRVVWVHGECQVVRDPEGRPLFLQGIAYDVTERKQAEEALRRTHQELEALVERRTTELAGANAALRAEVAERKRLEGAVRQRAEQLAQENRRKDHFLAVLAHELRNPLAPIYTSLQLLRQPEAGREVGAWAQAVIERQVRQMNRLIDDLLDISRINQGKIKLHKEALDLGAAVVRAVETTRPLLEERGHELSVTLPPGPLPLEADPVRLEQVVTNLLTNAAKYTEPGGRVWVTAAREGAEGVLRVRDTGVGIPPEMLERIFDMFAQVDRSAARASQWGLSIGLALVRNLVALHGGSVRALSAGPGQGSEFVVRLPLAKGAARGGGPTVAPQAAVRRTQPRRVLVVDDHAEYAQGTALLLRSWGHEARVAADGPSALAAARAAAPEVVLLDVGLPQADGYEVARQLRQLPGLDKALLVAVTGYGRDEDRRRAREAGFDYHLTKPVEASVLSELLAHGAARPAGWPGGPPAGHPNLGGE
jgi:two-component system CheB/CheR fusion protein